MFILLDYLSLWLNINSNIMNKKIVTVDCQASKQVRNPMKPLKERCKEMGAIPLSQFEKEFWDAFNEGYRKHGKH